MRAVVLELHTGKEARERRMRLLHAQILSDGASWKRERAFIEALDNLATRCAAEILETA